jgi:hypothetical protein
MSFFVGLILFIGVLGYLDTTIPWPRPRTRAEDDR